MGNTVSVIVPVYNTETTIARCINGVLPALEAEDELILINDGSCDTTEAICKAYAKGHAKIYVFSQKNQGPSAARNAGIEKAANPYLCFIDGDDEVDTAAFSSFLQRLRQEEPLQDIWFNDFYMMTPGGRVLRASRNIEGDVPQYGQMPLLRYLSGQGTYANVWRCVFRREFLRCQTLCFQDSLSCGEDLLFMTWAILAAQTTGFLHLPYYHYLVEQGESLSHNRSLRRVRDFLSAFQAAYERSDESEVGLILRRKLLHELLLLLPQLPELRPEDREEGARAMAQCIPALLLSPSRLHRVAAVALRCFGIGPIAKGLCIFKGLKRWARGLTKETKVV